MIQSMKTSIFTVLIALTSMGVWAAANPTDASQSEPIRIDVVQQDIDTSTSVPMAKAPIGATAMATLPSDTLWSQANTAYIQSDFKRAIELYGEILQRGECSVKLYYNLGNAYYKENRLGKAILNYNRALMLDPTDEDVAYNMALANARTVDKIDSVPEFFLKSWARTVGQTFGSDGWAMIGIVALGLGFAAIILWLLSDTTLWRKFGFYVGILAISASLISTYYAAYQRNRQLLSDEAIVMNLVAPVKSSPSDGSKDIFVLHEGTKVRVTEELNGWSEIVLSDGNKGWVMNNAIERIN